MSHAAHDDSGALRYDGRPLGPSNLAIGARRCAREEAASSLIYAFITSSVRFQKRAARQGH